MATWWRPSGAVVTIGTGGNRIKVHKAADVFPLLEGKAFEELCQSIERNGLLHQIVVDRDGILLDGRNRFLACEKVGVHRGKSIVFGGGPEAQLDYIADVNMVRRHLTAKQRKDIAVDMVPLYADAAKQRQRAGTLASDDAKGKATEKAAKAMGLSTSTVERALAATKPEGAGQRKSQRVLRKELTEYQLANHVPDSALVPLIRFTEWGPESEEAWRSIGIDPYHPKAKAKAAPPKVKSDPSARRNAKEAARVARLVDSLHIRTEDEVEANEALTAMTPKYASPSEGKGSRTATDFDYVDRLVRTICNHVELVDPVYDVWPKLPDEARGPLADLLEGARDRLTAVLELIDVFEAARQDAADTAAVNEEAEDLEAGRGYFFPEASAP